jgi:aryl-alcohol dehydrogenase-like predicted oxidoreductase
MPMTRILGRSGLIVSALGLGTARIGGLGWEETSRTHYSAAEVSASIQAIHHALDLGINYFDTADEYGCGHAETVLGQALRGHRQGVVISTKFGYVIDEATRQVIGEDASPAAIRRACEASLRRLGIDAIDIYLLHLRDLELRLAADARETLEELVAEGKIRFYGWSTDDPERAALFAQGPHCTAIMHRLNIMMDAPETLALCEAHNIASLNRIPLAMGLLSGRWSANTRLPAEDWRQGFFGVQRFVDDLEIAQGLRQVLTRDGRSYAQGALGWIWARSPGTVPVPGFRTAAHVVEDAEALLRGPLSAEQMAEIEGLLGRARQ